MTITVVREDDDFIIVDKPAGMPSAPLKNHAQSRTRPAGRSALDEICELCPGVRSVAGRNEWEAGLIHRLDTDTRGLLLAAKNRRAFDFLADEQAAGRFEKRYRALVTRAQIQREGFPSPPPHGDTQIVCESKFRAWGRGRREVRPVVSSSGNSSQMRTYAQKKAAPQTYITKIHIKDISTENLIDSIQKYTQIALCDTPYIELTLERLANHTFSSADCSVSRGFRHQVRAHLSWLGFPVIGDAIYGFAPKLAERAGLPTTTKLPMLFFAAGLRFRHPATGEYIEAGLGTYI